MLKKLIGLAGVMGLVAGCSSGAPEPKAGTVNEQGADNVVMQTRGIQAAVTAGDGATLSANVNSVAISGAQQIVQPSGALTAVLGQALRISAPVAGASGTVDCNEAGCRYMKYKPQGSDFEYDGSILSSAKGDGTEVVADLTMKGTSNASGSGSVSIDWKITGTLTVSLTSIKGTLQSSGTGEVGGVSGLPGGGGVSYEYENLVQYNDVVLNATGTAVSGSVYAKWSIVIDAPGAGGAGDQAWEGTVTFN